MSRRKIKQVDAIRQKTLETVIEEFHRHCRLKNLSPRTPEYYEEDLNCFQRSVPVESVREVTREVMEDFIDHEMQKGNRITAINTRLRGLRVFFRYCEEREYMGDICLKPWDWDSGDYLFPTHDGTTSGKGCLQWGGTKPAFLSIRHQAAKNA